MSDSLLRYLNYVCMVCVCFWSGLSSQLASSLLNRHKVGQKRISVTYQRLMGGTGSRKDQKVIFMARNERRRIFHVSNLRSGSQYSFHVAFAEEGEMKVTRIQVFATTQPTSRKCRKKEFVDVF